MRKLSLLVLSVFLHFASLHGQTGSWSVKTYGSGICRDIFFPDTSYGWAVGDSGKIMRSTNGGLSWANQTSPIIRNLYAVYFIDRNTGFAAGAAGAFLKTTNGGANWTSRPTSDVLPWKRLYFTDAQNGWLLSDTVASKIHHTTDGGLTWNPVGPQILPGYPVADMSFSSGTDGWVASDTILLHSADGVTWTNMNNRSFTYLFGISFPSDSTGYLLHVYSNGSTDVSVIYSTTNAGQTWSRLPGTFNGVILRTVTFLNPVEGWMAGDTLLPASYVAAGNVVYHTTDAGFHWRRELYLDSVTIARIHFSDQAHGWFAGFSNGQGTSARAIGKYSGTVTAVYDRINTPPRFFTLDQNYPNPFNPTTIISFSLARREHVRLEVIDLSGRVVQVIVDGIRPPGEYSEIFSGGHNSSGIYFYRLSAGSSSLTKKMILLR